MPGGRGLGRYKEITSSEIREVIFLEALARMHTYLEYGGSVDVLDDTYQSLMFLGPPGVGKSVLQKVGLGDVAAYLSDVRGERVEVRKVSLRVSSEDAVAVANEVAAGRAAPYVHLYLPQTKIWHLEGTPSPADTYVEVAGVKVPVNVWRVDSYLLPLMVVAGDKRRVVPGLLVLDEFNMARKEVLDALFQLARSAEIGRAKLSPFTVISLVGNTPETNIDAVRQLAAPLVDRAQNYVVSAPDVPGWLAYMNEVYGNKWAHEVGAFLALNKSYIYMQDESNPSILHTPRGWTHVATKIHVLRRMLSEGVVDREKFWKHVERVVYGTLVNEVADELVAFLRGLSAVSVQAVLEDPRVLRGLDRNVVAYLTVKVSSSLASEYVYEQDRRRKEEIAGKLVEVVENAKHTLGAEAVALVLTSLPAPVRLTLAKRVGEDTVSMASKTRRVARELEELLAG